MDEIKRTSEIRLEVGLNEENLPARLTWQAEDNPYALEAKECKAILLSLFDKESRDTMKIDLWTTDMQVIEMDRLVYNNLRALADTYFKATKNKELANDMQKFAQYFGEQTEILPKPEGE